MKFNIRFLRPVTTVFAYFEADSLAEAGSGFLGANLKKALFVKPENAGRHDGDTSYFAVVEIEGQGEIIARYFFGGIGRAGGIKPPRNPNERDCLAEVERDLGLNPGDISEAEWEGEESPEEARDRTRRLRPSVGAQ